jgi:hypothetical protein
MWKFQPRGGYELGHVPVCHACDVGLEGHAIAYTDNTCGTVRVRLYCPKCAFSIHATRLAREEERSIGRSSSVDVDDIIEILSNLVEHFHSHPVVQEYEQGIRDELYDDVHDEVYREYSRELRQDDEFIKEVEDRYIDEHKKDFEENICAELAGDPEIRELAVREVCEDLLKMERDKQWNEVYAVVQKERPSMTCDIIRNEQDSIRETIRHEVRFEVETEFTAAISRDPFAAAGHVLVERLRDRLVEAFTNNKPKPVTVQVTSSRFRKE